jgi:hypothetical protein
MIVWAISALRMMIQNCWNCQQPEMLFLAQKLSIIKLLVFQ